MDEAILKMQGITKRFPGVLALDHVNITLNKGEILALVGENGAGKSTLLKILSGAYTKDEGTIEYQGQVLGVILRKKPLIWESVLFTRNWTITEHFQLQKIFW